MNKEQKKGEIQELSLDAIRNYLGKGEDEIIAIEPRVIKHMHQQAKIGMQFEKEINLSERAKTANHLRVFRIVADDKEELKRLIKDKLPEYY